MTDRHSSSRRVEPPALRLGMYLHFPFCGSKCGYCDFASWADKDHLKAPYTKRLVQEIRQTGALLHRPQIDTVFLGGGTPTTMETRHMEEVLLALREAFSVSAQAEITCEANPASLREDFAWMLFRQGVNRLSFGVQSFLPRELQLLGRRHTNEDVADSLFIARQAGFENINLDLMIGLPGQTEKDLKTSLDDALALDVSHLSCYSLIVEEGTSFHDSVRKGKLLMPSQEDDRALYWFAVDYLESHGYAQYEISNFAKPHRQCRHNLDCWQYQEYLGLGLGASGFYQGKRSRNPAGLSAYLTGEAPQVESLSPQDSRFEQVMLGLRTKAGLSLSDFHARQGIPVLAAFPEAVQKHVRGGLLVLSDTHLRLTAKGFDLMDLALLDFLP